MEYFLSLNLATDETRIEHGDYAADRQQLSIIGQPSDFSFHPCFIRG
jgi:hypothetical protein